MARINFDPHPAQQEVLDSDARFRVMCCGRRFGKSLVAQAISLKSSAENRELVAYITPTYQLAKVFFENLLKELPAELYEANKSDLVIRFPTGGDIRFFTGERLDALRGLRFHLAIIDEAAYIPDLEQGWNNSIRPTLTDFKGKAIFLSTPKGKNFFYTLYQRGGDTSWQSFRFSTYDNPYIDKAEIEDAKLQLPESVFEQEYMANPSENAANPFGYAQIQQCTFPLSTEPAVCFGIDLAKSHDYCVAIGLDRNQNVCYFDRWQTDWRETVRRILSLPKAPICIDSTGNGDPIAEEIARTRDALLFTFTSRSKQQIMEGLAMQIQQRKITFPPGKIKDELEIFEYEYTKNGVKYSAPSGAYDDCVCALALAVHKFREAGGMGNYSFI